MGPDDILLGATGVHFKARTENRKKAKAVARASETALVLVHPPDQRPVHGDEIVLADVPKLKPGASHRVGARGKARGFEFGEYRAKICADFEQQVNESNEHNNCSDAGDVYVIAGSWTGTLKGTSPVDTGVTETWTSEDAVFVWDGGKAPSKGRGRFAYTFRGSLHYAISGSDPDGCAYSGSDMTTVDGSEDLIGDGLIFDYRREDYFGDQDITYPGFTWYVTCPGDPPQTVEGPYDFAADFINVNPKGFDTKPMPFGTTELTDSATAVGGSGFRFTWSWDLSADPEWPP